MGTMSGLCHKTNVTLRFLVHLSGKRWSYLALEGYGLWIEVCFNSGSDTYKSYNLGEIVSPLNFGIFFSKNRVNNGDLSDSCKE